MADSAHAEADSTIASLEAESPADGAGSAAMIAYNPSTASGVADTASSLYACQRVARWRVSGLGVFMSGMLST